MDNESNTNLTNINLEWLVDKSRYNKQLTDLKTQPIDKKDRRFYKKRVHELTRMMLNNEKPDRLTSDVKNAFDNYLKNCVEYFKMVDTMDIIQEDYSGFLGDTRKENADADSLRDTFSSKKNDDLITTRCFTIPKPLTLLDNFVTIKKTSQDKPPIVFPIQREIDLTDPKLKIKNISKNNNKNINTNYEAPDKKKSKDNNKKNTTES